MGDAERLAELGEWTPHRMKLRPESFKFSTFDVAIGGVGWVGVAADGDVRLQVRPNPNPNPNPNP